MKKVDTMFGFFKKKQKTEVNKGEKRKKQRRTNIEHRRSEIRWEPDKPDRRAEEDRRKSNKTIK